MDLVIMCDEFGSDVISETEETSILDLEDDTCITEEMKKMESIMEDQGIEGVKQELKANSDKWKNAEVHIAVTGSSGAGKSAFINALRGIKAEDEGGAEVGVKETTTDLTPYKHPNNPNIIVWDMPGVGTQKFPKETYLESVKFDQYDFFMIVSNLRFTEEDLWLAKQTQEQKKQFYFIRSSIDAAIYSDSRANEKSHSPAKVLSTVREDCKKNLKKAGIKVPKVFLVDNHDRQSFDFGPLEAQLLEDSDSIKMEAMALSLSTLTKESLQKKKQALEGRIWDTAKEIACEISLNDQYMIFKREMSLYMDGFGLDDQTLQDNIVILNLSVENLSELQTFVNRKCDQIARELKRTYVRGSFFKRLFRAIKWMLRLRLKANIPVLRFSCCSLKHNLDEMFKIALHVYGAETQKRLAQSVYKS